MGKKVNCILLVDDNEHDNFFHERVIKANGAANYVVAKQSGKEALEFLRGKEQHPEMHPDLIFLDINMPGMNGWDFLEEYTGLDASLKSRVVVVMLTTSEDPEAFRKAKTFGILSDFKTKPLTRQMLDEVLEKYF